MDYIFEVTDKTGRRVHLTKERLKHIQKHPHMQDPLDNILMTLRDPLGIRSENPESKVLYFYKEFKQMHSLERYLLVPVRYLNGKGFVITSFFTNRMTGERWTAK